MSLKYLAISSWVDVLKFDGAYIIFLFFLPLINGKTGTELVWEWLKKYEIDTLITDVTAEKPRAVCYIDDKAIQFINWNQALNDLSTFTNESFWYSN